MKKLLLLLATLIPFLSHAELFCVDGLNYDFHWENGIMLGVGVWPAGYSGGYSGNIVIPQSVKHDDVDYPVVACEPWAFKDCKDLYSIELPSCMTSLGGSCFEGCISLASINLPSGITSLGESCFHECSSLTSIGLPSQLKVIPRGCFEGSGLKRIVIPSNIEIIEGRAFFNMYLKYIDIVASKNPLTIKNCVFSTVDFFTLNLNRPLYFIKDEAGEGNSINLTALIIGDGITGLTWLSTNSYFIDGISQISSKTIYPPYVNRFPDAVYAHTKLIVPAGAKSNYENDPNWAFFQNITELDVDFDDVDISIDPTSAIINVGEKLDYSYTLTPNIDSDVYIWTSNYGVLGYEGATQFYGYGVGEVDVTAMLLLNGKEASIHVTVIQPATKVTLSKTNLELEIGQTAKIFANVSPDNVTDDTVTWSTTSAAVATVEDGTITAIGGGECDIIATAHNGVNAKCHVKVKQEANGISFNTSELCMNVGEQSQLEVTFTPENTTEKNLTWTSSNTAVASVDDGLVKAISRGEATITATTTNGLTATCAVNVIQPVVSVTISQSNATLNIGETLQLTANVNPENANDQSIIWSSDNSNIVTVSETGLVTAVMTGEANITATASNGVSASCKVTVRVVDPESITLDQTGITIYAGDSMTLTPAITPADATHQEVYWTTSDPGVATVEDGVVTGVVGGSCTVTATTVNGLEATCEVTVREKATEISLNETELNLTVGESYQLTVSFYPETTTERNITWVTSDASVATVEDGLVTVVGVGTARIKANYAMGISATCIVNGLSGVDAIFADGATCDVYTVTGILVRRNATREDLERLTPDVYILHRGATVVKAHLR